MGVGLLNIVLNWRNDLSNLPSAATGRRKRNGLAKTACLREPMFAVGLLIRFPLLVAAEGFLPNGFRRSLTGVQVAVVVWRFWRGKWTRTWPGMVRHKL